MKPVSKYKMWYDGKYWRQHKTTEIVEMWNGLRWTAI